MYSNVFGAGIDWGKELYEDIFGGAYIDVDSSFTSSKDNTALYLIGGGVLLYFLMKK